MVGSLILSFLTEVKIEFLLPFTGCRKVLAKMPVSWPHFDDEPRVQEK